MQGHGMHNFVTLHLSDIVICPISFETCFIGHVGQLMVLHNSHLYPCRDCVKDSRHGLEYSFYAVIFFPITTHSSSGTHHGTQPCW